MSQTLAVLGGGGHAKVVIGTAEEADYEITAVFDDRERLWGSSILGYPIVGPIDQQALHGFDAVLTAIGDNHARRDLANRLDVSWATLVHPSARVHRSVSIRAGTVVFAGAILQPDTGIGRHCVVNTGATVDHDCQVDDFSHIAPGAHLAGGIRVGAGCLIGIGAALAPSVAIGAWSVVGAGAVVISDIPAETTAIGVPARRLGHGI